MNAETQGTGAEVTTISGVGPARAGLLAELGVRTIRDLLLLAPQGLESTGVRASCAEAVGMVGAVVQITGRVERTRFFRRGGRQSVFTAYIADESGVIEAHWFNQSWLRETLVKDAVVTVAGRIGVTKKGKPSLVVPRIGTEEKPLPAPGGWEPRYQTVDGIGQGLLRGLCRGTLELATDLEDRAPLALLEELGLPRLSETPRALHEPRDPEEFTAARRRIALEGCLAMQARLQQSGDPERGAALPIETSDREHEALQALLPFRLTADQARVVEELRVDLSARRPMRRLLQGDVGTGKTAVAFYACVAAARAGAQAVLAAPTELLAEQHYAVLAPLFEAAGVKTCLLTGSTPARERKRVLRGLERGELQVAIGTHALFSEKVRCARLAVAVIDEQHRFGVAQRTRLLEKGPGVHVLLTTATPIPRTLALSLYGDLEVSVLKERPPGRGKVTTRWLKKRDGERLLGFLSERLAAGEQVFWVVPRIEQGSEERGAIEAHARLSTSVLSDHGVILVHGALDTELRQERLAAFRKGSAKVLVGTTVIEVGVDVPAATVLVVEGAERLGLAQLHQLRGRVGRGSRDGWCLLFGKSSAAERFELLEQTDDGFEIAEEDLRRRGMGELDGLRQSGGALDPEEDLDLALAARDAIAGDPALRAAYQADTTRLGRELSP
ncbi:MAG: ATP-dependent DNA helicase RecG [Planctomycetes bacterium]|nr:ATP-dependent DNA helicase RecG [Planctomycetota bacterium]